MVFKGILIVVLLLVLAAVVLRILDNGGIVDCTWFREHLGKVGAFLFPGKI